MLRQIGLMPPEGNGSFYDYLTGTFYTTIQDKLYQIDSKSDRHLIDLTLFATNIHNPQTYLHRLISIQGSVVFNSEGTIATNKTSEICNIRSTRPLSDRACWQFHIPGSLYGVQLGICHVSQNGAIKYLPFTFNSSTARTITFLIDDMILRAWVNQSSHNSKKNSKNIQWNLSECYPWAKLTMIGSSIIFNPFAVQPHTKITYNNPFNTHKINSQQPLKQLTPQPTKLPQSAKIIQIKQLNQDRLLLIAQGGYIKIIQRNTQNNRISFNNFVINDNTVWNLFTRQEWETVSTLKQQLKLGDIVWQNQGYNLEQVFNLLRQLIIRTDSNQQIKNNLNYDEISHILLTKLAIIRPYIYNKIPNSIYNCQIDQQQHDITKLYFKFEKQSPLRLINNQIVNNSNGWFKFQGNFIQVNQSYILCAKKCEGSLKEHEVWIYYVSNYQIKKIFNRVLGDQSQFSKADLLKQYSDLETNLFKENAQATQIYKILSTCFATQASSDNNIFQVQVKDVNELVQIFKIGQEDAVTALEQTGNIDDALAWLADINHKITRKKKIQGESKVQSNIEETKINCSIIKLPKQNLIIRILIHIDYTIYAIGFDPRTFANKYIQKTQKGFMNLSTFQYGATLEQIDGSFIQKGGNHGPLAILDQYQFAPNQLNANSSILFIYKDQKGFNVAVRNEDQSIQKVELQVNQQNIYKQTSCLKASSERTKILLKNNLLSKTSKGQLLTNLQQSYQPYTFVIQDKRIFSNCKSLQSDQIIAKAQVWLKFIQNPHLHFNQNEQHSQNKYLPLLVEHGPPGCNMNYPICSILYPKSPLQFLANYPYSLTFRHLHSKCMRVSSVVIQRIGQKQNVNEIKQGYIYFVDDANVHSEKYHFKFGNKNQLEVQINQKGYWRYMIIQPIYHTGSKLPYEIGFLGAKGISIEVEQYQKSVQQKLQQNLQVFSQKQKCRFDIIQLTHLSHSTYKATVNLYRLQKSKVTFKSKCPSIQIRMQSLGLSQQISLVQKQQTSIKTSQIATMTPIQIIAHMTKQISKPKQGRLSLVGLILQQIGRNQSIKLSQFGVVEIKKLVDLFLGNQELSVKDYQKFYDKINSQSKQGSKYLLQILHNIGKDQIPIGPKYLQPLLTKIITQDKQKTLASNLLHNLLQNLPNIRNQHYQIIKKQYECPYLLLQKNYYSKYYYNQIQGIIHDNQQDTQCQQIYKDQLIKNYQFITLKQNKYRKIIIKFNHKQSIRNILLRFDKSQLSNRANINIYAWVGQQKLLCFNDLFYEHQWIQITKNPYRKQMIAMFGNNHSWLNAYGVNFYHRVETSYLEIQVMFSSNGISNKQLNSSNIIQIMPQIYGYSVGSQQPVPYFQSSYFNITQDQKVFLSKLPLRLQIQSNPTTPSILFSKYLINKQNSIQFQLYQTNQNNNQQKNTKLKYDQLSLQYLQEIQHIFRFTDQKNIKVHDRNVIKNIVEKYNRIIDGLEQNNSHIRISKRISLDYVYTLIMWIIDITLKKSIPISQNICQQLLKKIIKVQSGPITLSCLKIISRYTNLLLHSLNYIQINSQDQKSSYNSVSTTFIKNNNQINITDQQVRKVVENNDVKLGHSLMNIIIDTKFAGQGTIKQCIQFAFLTGKFQKVINYILKLAQQPKSNNKQQQAPRQLFTNSTHEQTYTTIINFIFNNKISQQLRNNNFINKLNPIQLEALILCIRKLRHRNKIGKNLQINDNYLLYKLFNNTEIKSVSQNMVSYIFELGSGGNQQWDYLAKCIQYCPSAQNMVYCRYLSVTKQQPDELIQLVQFHREILFSAAKSQKNSELLACFLNQLYYCNKKLFVQVIMSLPQTQTQLFPLHPDILPLCIRLLQTHANLGGIQGTKYCTIQQSTWLATIQRILKLSNPNYTNQTFTSSQIQGLLKWYLLNNQYQQHTSNPINRSQSVTTMRNLSQYVINIIKKLNGTNINKIFKIYAEIKQDIKKDNKRLTNTKYNILARLQYGVYKLMQNNLESKSLTELLIGNQGSKGLCQEILVQLEEQLHNKKTAKSSPQTDKQINLTEQAQLYTVQAGTNNLTNLMCKDLQSYKTGSKSFITKVPALTKKLYFKSANTNMSMRKFIVGFNVQDSNQKTCILPDSVQLYGGCVENNPTTVPIGLNKICDLQPIQDQNFLQFGVKLFGINFDCIRRQYRNLPVNFLQLRMKSYTQASTSDILQCNQKLTKNGVYHVSFISANGHKEQVETQLSFSNIYMKMLTFLSNPQHSSTLDAFVKHVQKTKGMMNRFIQLLSTKLKRNSSGYAELEKLLIALGRKGVPVLEHLLKQSPLNNNLINKILKSNLSVYNLDLVLQSTLSNQLYQQSVNNLIQNIKISSLQHSSAIQKHSKIQLKQIVQISKRYQAQITKSIQEAVLVRKILACITTTHNIYKFEPIELIKKLTSLQNEKVFYPIIASFVTESNQALDWFLSSGKLDYLCKSLLTLMEQYNKSKQKTTQHAISNIICLISSLSIYPPIRQRLINNPDKAQINRLPIKIFDLLSNTQTLIQQYPTEILKKFINLFQSTCTASTNEKLNSCSQQFANKLIQVMVRLPEVSSIYHNYFIHQFFFHLINAYNGVVVNFIWKGQHLHQYFIKPTEVLEKLPIRKNLSVKQYNEEYYKLATTQEFKSNNKKILVLNDKIVAYKVQSWTIVNQPQQKLTQIKQSETGTLNLTLKQQTNTQKQLYKQYILSPTLVTQLHTLLTNQTLLRIQSPSIFNKKYTTTLPITQGKLPYVYLLPTQMTIQQMLKQFNICGYLLQNQSRQQVDIRLHGHDDRIGLGQKLIDLFNRVSNFKPVIQFQVRAHNLFKSTSVQKIANQTVTASKFVAQQTIFKSFQKLKGLQKMIKVIMACVKNWSNTQQNKIWSQYLSQLSTFSYFPIFSSIYMNKQQNVQLLFNLLSGLPDKQDNKKWLAQQKKSVRFLYDIIKNVFEVEGQQAIIVRNYAISSGFYQTMLQRLHIITKQPKRVKQESGHQSQQQIEAPKQLQKNNSEYEYKKQIKKKKGIGYGNDSSTNQKWDIAGHQSAKKELSEQIIGLINILQKFLSHPKFKLPNQFLESTYVSAILPILQASLRGGSLLQISKNAQLFKEQLRFIRTIASNQVLIPCLMQIPKIYEPKQSQSIFSLLGTLEGISKIFLNCLTGSVSEKTSQQIAKQIIETYNKVQQAIQNYKSDHVDQQADKKILELQLAKKYPILMKDLRFDYIDMKDKNGKMKHHYSSSYQAKHTSPATKTIRLAQQLADISQALPIQHTNAIFVRCDKDRVDFMQALIMGSNGTPYGHGAYLFDIYFDDSYPNNPPKVNLTTTGEGAIRFNPNLYACGKVCLSLLGTWRGSAMQNWDPKVSTLLQVLVSIQSIIMAEQIYFNQPGFEHEQGTVQGEKKNQGYSNIVRYGNIKFAMIQNLKNPPKGFENVIRRHFYLKKNEILQQCRKWVKFAQKREAAYTGLVSDHNNNWSNTFKKSKTEYKTMLQKAINDLEVELNKLPEPSAKDLVKQNKIKKEKKEKKQVKIEKDQNLQQIDVTYDVKNNNQGTQVIKQLDINDQKVKDRWSRYIGAMGLQAVNKQSKASILLFGLSGLGIQIAKNIVLSGCKRFTVCDEQNTTWNDLSGQFYLSQDQIGKNRVQACLYKLQDLNNYVRVDSNKIDLTKLEQENKLKQYQVVITTVHNDGQIILLDNYCSKNGIKFIAVKTQGPYGFIFNDFGNKFEVLDKNGEQAVQCIIQNITNEQNGVVTIMKGQKHPYEDGDQIKITNVKGMVSKTQQGKSINDSIHKIKVINQSSFTIGNTTDYNQYAGNGLVKNLKVATLIDFKSYQESSRLLNIDGNLAYYDFAKSVNNKTLHNCFKALSLYRNENKGLSPRSWNWEDAQKLLQIYKNIVKLTNTQQAQISESQKAYVYKFNFTCSGSFAPLAAFYGGLVAQEAFKAITSKYMPINQFFLTDFTEVIQELPKDLSQWKQYVINKKNYKAKQDRFEGIRSIIGQQTLDKIRQCKVFVIGSGAIGCQLLKNYAMINLATSEKPDKGTIVVTDPDHIETSNLNRQFLFRQKHLQKPKSATAAAVVKQMNKYLKGQNKIRAKLIKVCQATKDTFSNEFFESMDIVTNALDNVQARQYVDLRCIENKVALLQSGTLSTKGHVQVIVPYKTQTYGSKADPAEQGDIPHCTLKMFPEQTLHCVQWARDNFGKIFTMKPKALLKIIESIDTYEPNESEIGVLNESLQMLKEKPTSFDDAIYSATKQFYKFYRNDIKQLLYTYPLDAKTKDGKDFWKLPKRPPTPIEELNPQIPLHGQFITSYAIILCKVFNIPYPKDFRTQNRRIQIVKEASKIKLDPFVPSDEIAKQMAAQVEQNKSKKEQMTQEQITQKQQQELHLNYRQIFKQIKLIVTQQKEQGNPIKVTAQQFEKDDDANGHIDLIYSMANLRAVNYKLEKMDWITTKLKAGRITPALSTTTSCIAALQTIQLIKYLKKLPIDQMKNTFLNLAVPIVQAGQPGDVQKIKIHADLTTNIWQRWTVDQIDLNEIKMHQIFKKIQQKYKITIKTLNVAGGGPIYSDLVLGLESKKQQKQQFMKKKLKQVLVQQIAIQQLKGFVDLTLVMAVGQQFIKHVPTIRINFKK